jgi:hypothetical protein
VLRPGGTVARMGTFHALDEPMLTAFEAVYHRHAPDADPHGQRPGPGSAPDPLADSAAFTGTEKLTYSWERTLSADEWVRMVATFSDHQRLAPQRLADLQQALYATIERFGGAVHTQGGTYVVLSRRAG